MYQFVDNLDKTEKPEYITYFYYFSIYPNPQTNLYQMAKFYINGDNLIIQREYFNINKKQLKKYTGFLNINLFKLLPVYNISQADLPNLSDIIASKSEILNNNFNYTGYAPVN